MEKTLALRYEDDFENGAETVEIVFGIVLAVGLGAALIAFQGVILDALSTAKETVSLTFGKLASGEVG
jgi:hypothetical protein